MEWLVLIRRILTLFHGVSRKHTSAQFKIRGTISGIGRISFIITLFPTHKSVLFIDRPLEFTIPSFQQNLSNILGFPEDFPMFSCSLLSNSLISKIHCVHNFHYFPPLLVHARGWRDGWVGGCVGGVSKGVGRRLGGLRHIRIWVLSVPYYSWPSLILIEEDLTLCRIEEGVGETRGSGPWHASLYLQF